MTWDRQLAAVDFRPDDRRTSRTMPMTTITPSRIQGQMTTESPAGAASLLGCTDGASGAAALLGSTVGAAAVGCAGLLGCAVSVGATVLGVTAGAPPAGTDALLLGSAGALGWAVTLRLGREIPERVDEAPPIEPLPPQPATTQPSTTSAAGRKRLRFKRRMPDPSARGEALPNAELGHRHQDGAPGGPVPHPSRGTLGA